MEKTLIVTKILIDFQFFLKITSLSKNLMLNKLEI